MNTTPSTYFSFAIKTLWSPVDDVASEILSEVGATTTSIFMMIYGFTLSSLTDLLIQKHQAGLDVKCVLDLSQSKGAKEQVQIKRLQDAGVDVVIGTSPTDGSIMHEKCLILDGLTTITGSYNFSDGAATQVNHCDFFVSKDRADKLTDFFNYVRGAMLEKKGATDAVLSKQGGGANA